MSGTEQPIVLCVDDEPRILEGLQLHLRREYRVHLASSGDEALKKLTQLADVAVVISDMRMPGIDGATLLKRVMRASPETTRILLTGEPGRDVAAAAVNEGQIFRFLTKPCAPDKLKIAVEAAVVQHRLVSAERVLLQQTLIGCLKALVDVLAMTNPIAFGRASRLKRMAVEFSESLGFAGFWQLEAAAMLSQLGYISLPVELVEKLYYGERLTPEEQTFAEGVPQVTRQLLGQIPRLEPVLHILETIGTKSRTARFWPEGNIGVGAQILAIVLEYDSLIAQGQSMEVAMQTLRTQKDAYDLELLQKFAEHFGASSNDGEVCQVSLRLVRPGMTIMQDVRTEVGTLLVPRGFEVSEGFIQRMRNFGPVILAEKVTVLVHPESAEARAKEG